MAEDDLSKSLFVVPSYESVAGASATTEENDCTLILSRQPGRGLGVASASDHNAAHDPVARLPPESDETNTLYLPFAQPGPLHISYDNSLSRPRTGSENSAALLAPKGSLSTEKDVFFDSSEHPEHLSPRKEVDSDSELVSDEDEEFNELNPDALLNLNQRERDSLEVLQMHRRMRRISDSWTNYSLPDRPRQKVTNPDAKTKEAGPAPYVMPDFDGTPRAEASRSAGPPRWTREEERGWKPVPEIKYASSDEGSVDERQNFGRLFITNPDPPSGDEDEEPVQKEVVNHAWTPYVTREQLFSQGQLPAEELAQNREKRVSSDEDLGVTMGENGEALSSGKQDMKGEGKAMMTRGLPTGKQDIKGKRKAVVTDSEESLYKTLHGKPKDFLHPSSDINMYPTAREILEASKRNSRNRGYRKVNSDQARHLHTVNHVSKTSDTVEKHTTAGSQSVKPRGNASPDSPPSARLHHQGQLASRYGAPSGNTHPKPYETVQSESIDTIEPVNATFRDSVMHHTGGPILGNGTANRYPGPNQVSPQPRHVLRGGHTSNTTQYVSSLRDEYQHPAQHHGIHQLDLDARKNDSGPYKKHWKLRVRDWLDRKVYEFKMFFRQESDKPPHLRKQQVKPKETSTAKSRPDSDPFMTRGPRRGDPSPNMTYRSYLENYEMHEGPGRRVRTRLSID